MWHAVSRTSSKESSASGEHKLLAAVVPDGYDCGVDHTAGLQGEEQKAGKLVRLRTSEELDAEFEDIFCSAAKSAAITVCDEDPTEDTWKMLAEEQAQHKTYADRICDLQVQAEQAERRSRPGPGSQSLAVSDTIKRVRIKLQAARGLSSVVQQMNSQDGERAQIERESGK